MSSILFTCTMYFCLIYFNLGNSSNCIDVYLGIFVNRIEVEVEVSSHHICNTSLWLGLRPNEELTINNASCKILRSGN